MSSFNASALRPFSYYRPSDLVEASALLHGTQDGRYLARQTLLPLLNLRLTQCDALIDLSVIPGLNDLAEEVDGVLRIGAMVRHARLPFLLLLVLMRRISSTCFEIGDLKCATLALSEGARA
ncbi:hypothetical protein CCP2SC5_420029 [Azospirillaceae bacterium]